MQLITVALAVFFLVMLYTLVQAYQNQQTMKAYDLAGVDGSVNSVGTSGVATGGQSSLNDGKEATSEVVYTQDYYPFWRSTRWFNYDGWLYQKPYYNYWRRPSYYNYWYAGRPLIIGGKRYYRRRYW